MKKCGSVEREKYRDICRERKEDYVPCRERKEFWIMKEYGLRESWTQISLANSVQALQTLCSMKDNDFILSVLDEKFVLIDPKDGKKYEDFMIDGFQENVRKYHVEVYAESLISPNSITNFLISEGMNNNELFSSFSFFNCYYI